MASRFIRNNAHQWGQRYYDQAIGVAGAEGSDSSGNEGDGGLKKTGGVTNGFSSDKTITQTNFFECREVTNCEFIYEQSDKTLGSRDQNSGILSSLSKMFKGGNSGGSGVNGNVADISAMCAIKDLLVIGFSNGVLIVLDTDKLEITFSHKHFTKNDKPIDKLRVFNCGDAFSSA